MSNLNSQFDTVKGWPNGSALSYSFKQKDAVTPAIEEGTIVAVEDESGVAVVDRYTSDVTASGNPDSPWLVIQGADQSDADFADKMTCVKLRTGIVFKVATAETPSVGDLLWANAGVLTGTDPNPTSPHLGKVIEFNPTDGYMVVES
jgi:hypothetical protein